MGHNDPQYISFANVIIQSLSINYRSLIDLEGDSLMMKMGAESSELM